jgi:hypothetical protein
MVSGFGGGNVVNIRITAKDLASAKFSGVRKAAGLMSAAIAGAGLVSIKFGSDLVEAQNKAAVVFGQSVKAVQDFAKNSADAYGISMAAANEYAGTLGVILQATGASQAASADMSIQLVKLASDLSSFNNIPIDVALEKLRSGLVGEVEPLRTVGVLLSAAAVEAKAVELGLIDAGQEMTEQIKVQARFASIMEQTTAAQGDSVRTADDLAGSMRRAQAGFADAAASIGLELLPAATTIVRVLRDALRMFKDMPESLRIAVIAIGGVTLAFGALLAVLPPLIASVTALGVATSIALAGIPLIIAGITAGVTFLILKWDEVVEFMRGAGGWILAAFGPIGVAAKLVIDNWNLVIDVLRDAFNTAVRLFNGLVENINKVIGAMNKVAGVFGQHIPEINFRLSEWERATADVAAATRVMSTEIEESVGNAGDAFRRAAVAVGESTGEAGAAQEDFAISVQRSNFNIVRSNRAAAASFAMVAQAAGGRTGILPDPTTGLVHLFPGEGSATRAFLDQFFETGRLPQAGFRRNFAAPDTPLPGGGDNADSGFASGDTRIAVDITSGGQTIASGFGIVQDLEQNGGF